MRSDKPILLKRTCAGVLVPSGAPTELAAGTEVWLTQALGGSFTVMTDHGHTVRIDGVDGDALGIDSGLAGGKVEPSAGSVRDRVWEQLRSCFDPEIPVNIVDLGLVYECVVKELPSGGHKAVVHFTLTAQGCGMGQFLRDEIRKKLLAVADVRDAEVELVWDPPWNQSMIAPSAKHQLGME
jgi:probable FeS assembly SUF system protein SufT